jgi:hypothetical protein
MGLLEVSDWFYYDSELIRALSQHASTKKILQRDFFGKLPKLVFSCVAQRNTDGLDALGRMRQVDAIERFLIQEGCKGVYGYAFRDRGAFEKRIDFVDPISSAAWKVGNRSNSVIFYGFARSCPKRVGADIGEQFLEWIKGQC